MKKSPEKLIAGLRGQKKVQANLNLVQSILPNLWITKKKWRKMYRVKDTCETLSSTLT